MTDCPFDRPNTSGPGRAREGREPGGHMPVWPQSPNDDSSSTNRSSEGSPAALVANCIRQQIGYTRTENVSTRPRHDQTLGTMPQ